MLTYSVLSVLFSHRSWVMRKVLVTTINNSYVTLRFTSECKWGQYGGGSRQSVVVIVSRIQAAWPTEPGSISSRGKTLPLLQILQSGSGAHTASCSMGIGYSVPWVSFQFSSKFSLWLNTAPWKHCIWGTGWIWVVSFTLVLRSLNHRTVLPAGLHIV